VTYKTEVDAQEAGDNRISSCCASQSDRARSCGGGLGREVLVRKWGAKSQAQHRVMQLVMALLLMRCLQTFEQQIADLAAELAHLEEQHISVKQHVAQLHPLMPARRSLLGAGLAGLSMPRLSTDDVPVQQPVTASTACAGTISRDPDAAHGSASQGGAVRRLHQVLRLLNWESQAAVMEVVQGTLTELAARAGQKAGVHSWDSRLQLAPRTAAPVSCQSGERGEARVQSAHSLWEMGLIVAQLREVVGGLQDEVSRLAQEGRSFCWHALCPSLGHVGGQLQLLQLAAALAATEQGVAGTATTLGHPHRMYGGPGTAQCRRICCICRLLIRAMHASSTGTGSCQQS